MIITICRNRVPVKEEELESFTETQSTISSCDICLVVNKIMVCLTIMFKSYGMADLRLRFIKYFPYLCSLISSTPVYDVFVS